MAAGLVAGSAVVVIGGLVVTGALAVVVIGGLVVTAGDEGLVVVVSGVVRLVVASVVVVLPTHKSQDWRHHLRTWFVTAWSRLFEALSRFKQYASTWLTIVSQSSSYANVRRGIIDSKCTCCVE